MSETQARRSPYPKWGRMTIDLDPELHKATKLAATSKGVTLREHVTQLLENSLEREPETRKAS